MAQPLRLGEGEALAQALAAAQGVGEALAQALSEAVDEGEGEPRALAQALEALRPGQVARLWIQRGDGRRFIALTK